MRRNRPPERPLPIYTTVMFTHCCNVRTLPMLTPTIMFYLSIYTIPCFSFLSDIPLVSCARRGNRATNTYGTGAIPVV